MKKIKYVRPIIMFVIVIVLGYIISFGLRIYNENALLTTIKTTLHDYFKETNVHIASHDFSVNDIKIRCEGKKSYLVEFNIVFDDKKLSDLNKLGAIVYKKNNKWLVKGSSSGISDQEIRSYEFKCHN